MLKDLKDQVLTRGSPDAGARSFLWPRLLTAAFSAVLLASFFLLVRKANGFLSASVGAALVIASPGFLELS